MTHFNKEAFLIDEADDKVLVIVITSGLKRGDLVLRKVTMATRDPARGKLGPNWKVPYKIIDYNRRGTYYLETLDRQRLHHP